MVIINGKNAHGHVLINAYSSNDINEINNKLEELEYYHPELSFSVEKM